MPKAIAEIACPPEFSAAMEKHGRKATAVLNRYLVDCDCKTNDDRLGAMGVLLHLGFALGDSLQAMELERLAKGKPN